MGTCSCPEHRAQPSLSSIKKYQTNGRSCRRLDFRCPWLLLSGKPILPVSSFRTGCSDSGMRSCCGLARPEVAVAPLRTGPTCTAAGGPASCQPSSSSLTATGGFLSREKIPPFPSPPAPPPLMPGALHFHNSSFSSLERKPDTSVWPYA